MTQLEDLLCSRREGGSRTAGSAVHTKALHPEQLARGSSNSDSARRQQARRLDAAEPQGVRVVSGHLEFDTRGDADPGFAEEHVPPRKVHNKHASGVGQSKARNKPGSRCNVCERLVGDYPLEQPAQMAVDLVGIVEYWHHSDLVASDWFDKGIDGHKPRLPIWPLS